MTPIKGGALSTTYAQRFTDEAIRRDWAQISEMQARTAALRASGASGYLIARTEAQLALSVEEYEENDRTGILEPLLTDALRLVGVQEAGQDVLAVDISLPALPGLAPSHPVLWQVVAEGKNDPLTLRCAGEPLARLEIGLLELAHEQFEVDTKLNTPEHSGPSLAMIDGLAEKFRRAALACKPQAPPEPKSGVIEPLTLSAAALFRFDQCREADILPEGRKQLDRFGAQLAKHPEAWRGLIITGHTDRLGTPAYNAGLSLCRANTVRDYLVRHFDLAVERFETLGLAARQPLVSCDDADAKALRACLQPNRRVEIGIK
ncbi:MAG: OmpA family protein [Pseudomonadota bacterium]|nr:OmpA family protein [Pseudomonadota bacterium]